VEAQRDRYKLVVHQNGEIKHMGEKISQNWFKPLNKEKPKAIKKKP
jgi:hypothetical protein